MEQKWETEARLREVFKKHQGITDSDIDYIFNVANASGMPMSDELIPFYAAFLTLNRNGLSILEEGKNLVSQNEQLKSEIADKLVHFTSEFKKLYSLEKSDAIERVSVYESIRNDVVADITDASLQAKENLKLELEVISRRSIDTAISAAKDGITENVQDVVSGISSAIIDTQAENKALELHKLSEQHRRSQNIFMVSAAGLIGLSIITTAVFTHITTRENTQVIANELVEYARKPDAQNYLQWLRMYDENAAVILRTCGASGDKIFDKSGLCTPTIRVSDNVGRVFTGSSVMSQIENWFLSRSSYMIVFITFLGTIAGLIFVPLIWNNKYVRWTKRKLKYLYRNRLFNA